MKIEDIQKKKNIAILWFWKEGKTSLKFLQSLWCSNISILDKKPINDIESSVQCFFWENYLRDIERYDLIIKSVWISPYTTSELQRFTGEITTATEIFFSNYGGKVIGITGTKGKSTTSSLCYHVLQSLWHKVALLWNIWTPALDHIGKKYDYVIYELSSYMLEDFSPELEIWVLINIFVDHLDWYNGDFEKYKSAKIRILENAKKRIINHRLCQEFDHESFSWALHYNERDRDINFHEGSFYIGDHAIFTHEWIHLEWEHNMENITCVLSILRTLWIDVHDIKKILTNFCALPHRLQDLWSYNNIRFIDDAISTTPESTIEAIRTYKDSIWTIFLWGSDRWYSFDSLIASLEKYTIRNIVLFPDSGNKIAKLLDTSYNFIETDSMRTAVEFAFSHTQAWEICLLSTASPSYSLWENFEAQWKDFKSEIEAFVKTM